MKGPETKIVNKILKYLREDWSGWWVKIHGGIYQVGGLPDIVGCYRGRFFAFEVKTPKKFERSDSGLTKRQEMILRTINNAGGHAEVVCDLERVRISMRHEELRGLWIK